MRSRAIRWFFSILAFLIVLALILSGVGVVAVRRAFPQVDGSLRLPGLQGQVTVYRDPYGIPHIYASTAHDLFMAQGYVHAQDRFWQMEFWRRIGSGRLSEIFGESTLDQDRFIRTLGWHRTAAEELELLDDELRSYLQAYADGVNAYIEQNPGRLGLEFTVLGLTGVRFKPEPWTPLNSLTYAKVMAWDLGGNRSAELKRAQIVAQLGTGALETLIPPYAEDYPIIAPHAYNKTTFASVPDEVFHSFAFGEGMGLGSNNWVISGDRTETGMPILANDPHLGIQMPSIWYEIGLHCEPVGPACPFNVVGFSFASAPGVIIGHNDRIAWGVTNLGPDVQDWFIEQMNPENPDQYLYKGEWRDMEILREEIIVAGRDEPVIVRVRKTIHGPIMNDVAGGTEDEWAFGWQPLAFSWTALQPGTVLKAVLGIDRAQNWDEFHTALGFWDVPSQNFVYADIDGNIGYQAPGRIPIRAKGDGTMPVPGWDGEYDWTGYIPYELLPRAFNPAEGFIVTANNRVVGPDYPYLLTKDWNPGYRARRITELIENDPSISIQDVQAFQGDNVPVYAQDILPYFLELAPENARLNQALDLLRAWDGHADRDSAAAALFESLRGHLVDRIFGDELGQNLLERTRSSLMVGAARLLPDVASPWFDNVLTAEVEDRAMTLTLALQDAVDELTETLGEDMSDWAWGDLHTATFRNQSLGESGIRPIEMIFNRGPVPVDGAIGTVNNTAYELGKSYDVDTVPSMRQIIDLADLTRSLSMHTTGQSGHAFNQHYDDMIDPWRDIQYHPMLWTRAQIEASAEAVLTLTP